MTDYRRYRAYGEEMIEPENGFGFTSREYDNISGLYYYRSRYYDPRIGRFIQKDKYNEAGILNNDPEVIYNPSQLNNYVYVANNPVNYVDPWGEKTYSIFNSQIGSFVGSGSGSYGFAMDDSGNMVSLLSFGGGGGTPAIINSTYFQITNASSVYDLEGTSFAIGGTVTVPISPGLSTDITQISAEIVLSTEYFGFNLQIPISNPYIPLDFLPGAELHAHIEGTVILNQYDDLNLPENLKQYYQYLKEKINKENCN